MASKSLRKMRAWGLTGFGFTDDFDPRKYPVTWLKFQKYVDKKEKSMMFKALFKPLYKEMLEKELSGYYKGGHKLSASLKKEIKSNVKQIATEMVKAKLQTAFHPAQQGYKEQEDVLPEG